MLDNVPYEVCLGEKVLWGDVEAFIESVESGKEAESYDNLCAYHLNISDQELRHKIGNTPLPGCV